MKRLLLLLLAFAVPAVGQSAAPVEVAHGVWFLLGDSHAGYCNSVVIEMKDYLILVDTSYPGRAKELQAIIPQLSSKPVRYVFDTHAHGDHSYGNSVWTKVGATTLAYERVVGDMAGHEPARWQSAITTREDVRATGEQDVERPKQTFTGKKLVLRDSTREVEFLHFGWGHTSGDGFVWLPKERILATGDAAVNGPRNNLKDADIANWPRMVDQAAKLRPVHVLPGHGPAGGIEVLTGQAKFLRDLYDAVRVPALQGKKAEEIQPVLPAEDSNWVPASLKNDIAATWLEITSHKPAGANPHP